MSARFDTSGEVHRPLDVFQDDGKEWFEVVRWPDLSPFVQGYVEALFEAFRSEVAGRQYEPLECSDGGWTISWLDDDGQRVPGRFVWYCSMTGRYGRAEAQIKCDQANRTAVAFSDLAPETLARIMSDCERFRDLKTKSGRALLKQSYSWGDLWREAGANFWRARQRLTAFDGPPYGGWEEDLASDLYVAGCNFKPLTPYLDHAGKVRFREG